MLATESRHQSPVVRDIEFVPLAPVTNIYATPPQDGAPPTFVLKVLVGPATQILEFLVQAFCWKLIQNPPQHGARIVFYNGADQNAEGGKCARTCRDDHLRDAQARSQFAGVQSACSAESHQYKFARVITTLN